MNPFIDYTTSTNIRILIDPDRVVTMTHNHSEHRVYINAINDEFSFGSTTGSYYGTEAEGLEIMQKILEWRNDLFKLVEDAKTNIPSENLTE